MACGSLEAAETRSASGVCLFVALLWVRRSISAFFLLSSPRCIGLFRSLSLSVLLLIFALL